MLLCKATEVNVKFYWDLLGRPCDSWPCWYLISTTKISQRAEEGTLSFSGSEKRKWQVATCSHMYFMRGYKVSPGGLPAPLKEEQNSLLMSGGWLGPRVTVAQGGRAPGAPSVHVFRLCTV